MPLCTALGMKSSTSVASLSAALVAPLGAPGSAPSPPQPGVPASRKTAASSATARLIWAGTYFIEKIWVDCRRLPDHGKFEEERVQERGLAAYLAELIGTLLLVFFITSVVVLFVSTGGQAQFGSDFAVIGLGHAFLRFGLIVMFGVVSGGQVNPVGG